MPFHFTPILMFLKWRQAVLSYSNVDTETYAPLSLRVTNVGSMESTSFLFWREKEYLPMSWSSYIKFYFARSLWCSGSALLPWVMTTRSNFSSSTLALQEGGEKPGHVFQGLSHVTPGTLLFSMCFISIDSVLLEVKNYSDVFIFVSPVPTI